ncbi:MULTISPECIES: Hsp20/alpha crystallin family protein [Sphingobium]|uniref:Hsp20/alpha crystallin family protein n=1 Tax=Sphingobium TaxID=165695 RepID=UPI000E73C8F3|nr:Hsp20 family protein [Sphingobium sp. YG1]
MTSLFRRGTGGQAKRPGDGPRYSGELIAKTRSIRESRAPRLKVTYRTLNAKGHLYLGYLFMHHPGAGNGPTDSLPLGELQHIEFVSTAYERSFQVSEGFDPDKTDASMRDGVLTLRLYRSEKLAPRKISVKAG